MEKLLTIKDICDSLRVSKRTVYRMIKDGKIQPPVKVGHSSRWFQVDLLKAVEIQRGV